MHRPDDTPLEVIESLIPLFQKYCGKLKKCPKCNSENIKYSYVEAKYICKDCGTEFREGEDAEWVRVLED